MGLIASTEIQKRKVEEICKEILYVTSDGDGVRIDDVITFDEMAEIVDYIRTTNITNSNKLQDLQPTRHYTIGNPISEVYNCDCIEYMRGLPDNAFDLVIADPPYGLGEGGKKSNSRGNMDKSKYYSIKDWDKEPPQQVFFDELLRVSRYAVIWGANHFISRIPIDSHCWIVWDKDNGQSDFADCELAWTNLPSAVRKFKFRWNGMWQENMANKEHRIHPTQKPVALYGWLLKTFLPKIGGGRVFDPMMGSQSSRIAAYKLGYDYCGCELDKEYFDEGNERFERECHGIIKLNDGTTIKQLSIFD